MICKDCIHYQMCHSIDVDAPCAAFKNKADFVEVVRCGKCKYFIQSKEDECAGTCNHPMSGLSGRICKSDFCGYGQRSDING